jgi:hypothetical protein
MLLLYSFPNNVVVLFFRRLSLANHLHDEGARSTVDVYNTQFENITEQRSGTGQKGKQNKVPPARPGEIIRSHVLSDDEIRFLRRRQVELFFHFMFFCL